MPSGRKAFIQLLKTVGIQSKHLEIMFFNPKYTEFKLEEHIAYRHEISDQFEFVNVETNVLDLSSKRPKKGLTIVDIMNGYRP